LLSHWNTLQKLKFIGADTTAIACFQQPALSCQKIRLKSGYFNMTYLKRFARSVRSSLA
jgi:hypothetical protein